MTSTEPAYDLLTVPALSIREPSGATLRMTLAEVLARLSSGVDLEFCGLQAHQEAAWHSFLVQVAALVLSRDDTMSLSDQPADWVRALRALSGSEAAWCLVVPDLAQPAFFQPPVPEGTLDGFAREECPDEIDVLVLARNHDVKQRRSPRATPELWAYALVATQTVQGFSGRGNYGILRMNGGFGNRPHVAHAPGLGWSTRFRRDVSACGAGRAAAIDRVGFADAGGVALAWTVPWGGDKPLEVGALDPWFVETCRRIRLRLDGGRMVACRAPTQASRVAAREETSDTADPWTPVDRATAKSMTLSAAGFGYDRTQELLFGGKFALGAAGDLRPDDGAQPWFIAVAMVRGQGRTEGLHQRLLRVPRKAQSLLAVAETRDRLRTRARERVDAAKTARVKVLGPALAELVGRSDASKPVRVRWLAAFDAEVDAVFFEDLWESADLDDEHARCAWERALVGADSRRGLARGVLGTAIESLPLREADRYRVVARAESMFEACARRQFPSAFQPAEGGRA